MNFFKKGFLHGLGIKKGFLKARIKFDRFIKEKRKKLNLFQFLSLFSDILKHRIKNKHKIF